MHSFLFPPANIYSLIIAKSGSECHRYALMERYSLVAPSAPAKVALAGAGDSRKMSPPVGSASPEFGCRKKPLLRPTFARRSWSPARTLFSGQRSLTGAADLFRQPAPKKQPSASIKALGELHFHLIV
jgi:hypothetical protein